MVKQRNIQHFTAKFNGREINFRCYTTWTRNGFCHTAHCTNWDIDITDTKQSYINRTWERFDYETVLKRAIDKLRKETNLTKEVIEEIRAQIIDRKAAEEHEKAEAFLGAFTKMYEGLSPENKETLAKSDIEINTEEDAKAVMGLMGLMTLTQEK